MSRGALDEDRDSDEDAAARSAENALHSRRRPAYRPSRLQIVLRLLAPAAAALALVSVITEDTSLDHDLLLVAPPRAEAGQRIPLRALFYEGLNRPAGPALAHAKTTVELRDAQGQMVARTELRAGFGPSLEGELTVPHAAQGKLTIVARTHAGEERVEVERALAIGAPEPAVLAPRALGPLQQLAHGPLRPQHGQRASDGLTLRVAGSACAPELPCELLVRIGEPAAALEVASTPSVTVERAAPSVATSGIARLSVRTHGPEGNLELRAGDASRAVRLPVALGADVVQLPHVVLDAQSIAAATLLGDNVRGIADLFKDERWVSSQTVRGEVQLPLVAPGFYRAQLRRDPFESESAAVRSLYVRAPSERDPDVLRALARRVVERERARPPEERDTLAALIAQRASDAAESGAAEAWAAADFDGASRYLLAALDDGIARLPTATSGYPLARKRALEHREDVRKLALVIVLLAAASLVVMLVHRGLVASDEAALVLRASGTAHASVRREQLRMTVRVVGSALAVLLVFCAIALYLILRGRAL